MSWTRYFYLQFSRNVRCDFYLSGNTDYIVHIRQSLTLKAIVTVVLALSDGLMIQDLPLKRWRLDAGIFDQS